MQQRTGVTVATDLDQPILPVMGAQPIPITLTWIVIDPPEIGRRVYRLGFLNSPRRRFDQIQYRPSTIIERCTSGTEGPARTVEKARSASHREPPALKPRRRPFKEIETAERKLEPVEHAGVAATEKHAVDVQV